MGMFRSGGMPEPPPPEYRGKGPAPGSTLREMSSLQEIARMCRDWNIASRVLYSNSAPRREARFDGCYIPALHAVVVPAKGVVPEDLRRAIIDHENTHSWGKVHRNGRDWLDAPAPPKGLLAIGRPPEAAIVTPAVQGLLAAGAATH